MDMTMTSKDSAAATNASTHHHQQQQEGMGTAVEEARNVKKPRQQAVAASGIGEGKPRPDEPLECPRCKSRNTKFCYYNNYNTSQPRYLCKACRRFWTQGGILRNVPVGSGYRKKRSSASLSSSSSSINEQPQQHQVPASSTTENDFTTSFDLSGSHLPFPPPALSSLAPAPPLLSGAETPSFLDMLRGGFLDYESTGFYGPMSSDMETLPFGHGAVMQNGVAADHAGAAPIGGEGATAASTHQGGQWPTTEQVGTDQQQKDASVPDNAKAE